MIGFYDYTVILTYLSLLSGTTGILLCLNGIGHPYLGMFFLLFSGLCDTFDGKVARSKKNRTDEMKKFGIQIDSLSDLIAFGVLPACIGISLLRYGIRIPAASGFTLYILTHYRFVTQVILTAIAVLYVLAAMIRLAYFNVKEEADENRDENGEKIYLGLPVTSTALIFPAVLLIHILISADLTLLYFGIMLVVGFLFLAKIRLKKPQNKGIALLVVLGLLEFIILILVLSALKR
ncbi:MAG: CDP-alcohol phosphatidyltransferase family protein [Lachnospiraceae bacterium]|nr:CDP-alcohol phosphatidyltransferase family protein [Lachnospiraceae bacterium]